MTSNLISKKHKRYPIESTAEGGQGTIYFCKDKYLNRKVAIKCVKDDKYKSRLIDEIRALEKISSKHVVEVFDLIEFDDQFSVVLEYISGTDLDKIDLSNKTPNEAVKIIYQIASGLSDIHSNGQIHRDIKPNNMRLDGEGIVKIYDFGLSRIRGVDDSTVGFNGTPGFAAPELYPTVDLSQEIEFTQAVDVFAFGATVWYLYIKGLPDFLRSYPPKQRNIRLADHTNLPEELADLIDATMDYDPANRPSITTVRDLAENYLVQNQHEAAVIYDGSVFRVNKKQPTAKLGKQNGLIIKYDGIFFRAIQVYGEVKINNNAIPVNSILPRSSVITIGEYTFVTLDISHPEVIL